jgi:ribosomal protein S12 methylthiotransferase accessory factor
MLRGMIEHPAAPVAPVLYLTPYGDEGPWPFHLVSARIEWPAGGTSEGWGRDDDAALAQRKAMAEAVERHAYSRLPPGAHLARATELDSSIEPDALVRYEEDQYRSPRFPCVRHDGREQRWWLPAQSADGGRSTHVLADVVCAPAAFDAAYRTRMVTLATSSGCASGASLGDAIARGTLELVERDAFMRHWFAQVPGDVVISASLPTWCARRLDALRSGGCAVGVQCLTLGLHPSFLVWAQHEELHFTCVAAAAAFSAESALRCALSEMETIVVVRLHGDPPPAMQPHCVRSPADHGALYATQEYFRRADAVLRAPSGRVRFADVQLECASDPPDLYARMRGRGHPVYWVDLSLAEAGNVLDGQPLHSVRTLAPGLLPIGFGELCQPLGMVPHVAAGGRFLHPFQ